MKVKPKKSTNLAPFDEWRCYLRVSDEDKQTPERSFAMQRDQINKYLLASSTIPIGREYIDILTGTTIDRDDFKQLIADAEAGWFSHLAIYRADRFCRNAVEGMQVTQKLVSLGIKIRMASMPSLAPETPDGSMMFYLLMTLAQYEVDVLRMRTDGGMKAKLLAGGWAHKAPEGYKNCERAVSSNKYDRWVEIDNYYIKGIRRAWQLLLTDEYTLVQICQLLSKEGYSRSSGRPWSWIDPKTKEVGTADVSLYKVFHNPFYAGWVISEKHEIKEGQIKGNWEPAVSQNDFELGREILRRHDMRKIRNQRYIYLLRDLLLLEHEHQLHLMYGSTPSGRSHPYPYYLTHIQINGKRAHLPCSTIDHQIPGCLEKIMIPERVIAKIQTEYEKQVNQVLSKLNQQQQGQAKLQKSEIQSEEEKLVRLYMSGQITDETYRRLRSELTKQLSAAERSIQDAKRNVSSILGDLKVALEILPHLSELYECLKEKRQQRSFLRVFMSQIIINMDGAIIKYELKAPFQYLKGLARKIDQGPNDSSQLSFGAQKNIFSMIIALLRAGRFRFSGQKTGKIEWIS
jgi:DNA invertase Pin-like site-specific DNA recombinase